MSQARIRTIKCCSSPRTLAYNYLKKWHGTLFKILPKLEFLDVTGNGHFNIMKNKLLLTDSSLKTIVGATTSKDCRRCNFTRTDVPRNLLTKTKGCEFIPLYNMPKIDHFQKKYLYFNGACEGKSCPLNLVPMWIVQSNLKNAHNFAKLELTLLETGNLKYDNFICWLHKHSCVLHH